MAWPSGRCWQLLAQLLGMRRRACGHCFYQRYWKKSLWPCSAHTGTPQLSVTPEAGWVSWHWWGTGVGMPQLQKQTGSHLTLSSVPSPSVATPAPVGPLQWHQGVRPARQRLALASSFQQATSGAPCAPHSPPRAVGLITPRCQLLQGKCLCPTSSAAHTLPSRRAACVELLGSPVGPPSPPTPAAPTATGVRPISSCCNGQFYG